MITSFKHIFKLSDYIPSHNFKYSMHNALKSIFNTLDFLGKNIFFQKENVLRLPMNGICQYHNMIALKHLLSANAEHLLFCH